MHFQEIVREERPSVALLMRNKAACDLWRSRLEENGINVILAVTSDLSDLSEHAVHIQAAKLVLADMTGDGSSVSQVRCLREMTMAPLIVLGVKNELAHARQLRQMGVTEYFVEPGEANSTIYTIRRILHLDEVSQVRPGRLVAVHGLRSGVGASMITAGLADIMSQKFQRTSCAVDMAFSSPSVGSWLGCDRPGPLNTLLSDIQRLDQSLLEQGAQTPFPGLSVFDGEDGDGAEQVISATSVRFLSSLLAEHYHCQLWRAPSGAGARQILLEADVCVLVGDGSLPALRAGLGLLPWLKQHRPNTRVVMVFNQTRPHMSLNADYLSRSIGQPIDFLIPYQKRLCEQAVDNLPFHSSQHTINGVLTDLAVDIFNLPELAKPWWKKLV